MALKDCAHRLLKCTTDTHRARLALEVTASPFLNRKEAPHDDRSRTAYLRPPKLARPSSAGLLLRHGLRPLVAGVDTVGARRGWCWSPPHQHKRRDVGLVERRRHLRGTDPLGVHHDGHNRREGRLRRLLGRYVLWRVGIGWYLFALLGVPLIMLLGTVVVSGDLPNLGALGGPSYVLSYIALFVLVFILGGPLLEEPGWRGFVLPRLERLHGPLVGTLILGVLWALWHLPEFWTKSWDTPKGSVLDIIWFVLVAVALAIVYTWVFNNTRGSLLLVILAH